MCEARDAPLWNSFTSFDSIDFRLRFLDPASELGELGGESLTADCDEIGEGCCCCCPVVPEFGWGSYVNFNPPPYEMAE